jgi:RNA polymerase sigma factor (sigma-70 family)
LPAPSIPEPVSADLEAVYAELRRRILATLRRIRPHRAEDLAQEVMLILVRKYSHLRDPKDLLPVAFAIMHFVVRDDRRKRPEDPLPEVLFAADGFNSEKRAILEAGLDRLEQAVLELGGKDKSVTEMRLQGCPDKQIAEHLGITTGYVQVIAHRSVLRLREIFVRLGVLKGPGK